MKEEMEAVMTAAEILREAETEEDAESRREYLRSVLSFVFKRIKEAK